MEPRKTSRRKYLSNADFSPARGTTFLHIELKGSYIGDYVRNFYSISIPLNNSNNTPAIAPDIIPFEESRLWLIWNLNGSTWWLMDRSNSRSWQNLAKVEALLECRA